MGSGTRNLQGPEGVLAVVQMIFVSALGPALIVDCNNRGSGAMCVEWHPVHYCYNRQARTKDPSRAQMQTQPCTRIGVIVPTSPLDWGLRRLADVLEPVAASLSHFQLIISLCITF